MFVMPAYIKTLNLVVIFGFYKKKIFLNKTLEYKAATKNKYRATGIYSKDAGYFSPSMRVFSAFLRGCFSFPY
jgi:hypothetical protein